MRCQKCGDYIEKYFTSDENEYICGECLEKQIYKERKKIQRNLKRGNTRMIITKLIILIAIILLIILILMQYFS